MQKAPKPKSEKRTFTTLEVIILCFIFGAVGAFLTACVFCIGSAPIDDYFDFVGDPNDYIEKPVFVKIAEHLADERIYNEEHYNCVNFSKELVRRLENQGYNAEYCVGDALWCNVSEEEDGSCRHAWSKIELFMESVSGELLSPEEFGKNYKIDYCEEQNK